MPGTKVPNEQFVYKKQPLNKGHLCIKAKTLLPKGVGYRGSTVVDYLLIAFSSVNNESCMWPLLIAQCYLYDDMGSMLYHKGV